MNTSTGGRYARFRGAIDDAAPGDELIADPALFACETEPEIDFAGKALVLQSHGNLARPEDAITTLADGASLGAGRESKIDLDGRLLVPPTAAATIESESTRILARVHIDVDGTLLGDPSLAIAGVARFRPSGHRAITTTADVARSVFATDLDGDGDTDVLSASFGDPYLAWYEQVPGGPGEAPSFNTHVITTPAAGVQSVFAADIDGDGDTDVLSASFSDGAIAWHEQIPGAPGEAPTFVRHVVTTMAIGAREVYAADVDGDGDTDVLSASELDDTVAWYEQVPGPPGEGLSFTRRVITTEANGANSVFAIDMDGDGDTDVLSASAFDDTIAWYQQVPGGPTTTRPRPPPSFIRRVITTQADNVLSVFASDIDGDGDTDVLSASSNDDTVAWYQHVPGAPGEPPTFVRRVITAQADGAFSVFAADVDGDGDTDVLSTSSGDDTVAWYEQLPSALGEAPEFTRRVITTRARGPWSVFATDVDGDGDTDVLSASYIDDTIAWYEHTTDPLLVEAPGSSVRSSGDLLIRNRSAILGPTSELGAGAALSVDATSSLGGSGTARAVVVASAGVVAPDPGATLTVDGAYAQSFDDGVRGPVAGELRTPLGDGSAPAKLAVTGPAFLEGSLVAAASAGFDPPAGAAFEVLTASSIEGRFDVAFLPSLPDRFLTVEYPGAGAAGDRSASVLLRVNDLDADVEFDPAPSAGAEGGVPSAATLADVNLDGFVDLVMTVPDGDAPSQAPGSALVFYNDGEAGDGSWNGFASVSVVQQVFTGIGIQPDAVAVGDVNDDGIPDLVVANRGVPGNAAPDSVTVLINEPGASGAVAGVVDPFGVGQVEVLPVGDEPRDVVLADLDGDTLPEIVTANAGSDDVTVLWNSGSDPAPARAGDRAPNWRGAEEDDTTDPLELPEESCPLTIRPGEFDAGLVHLVVANTGLDSISFVRNDGGRTLTLLPPRPVDREPVQLVVADLDLDGALDVVTVNRLGNGVSVLLNRAGIGTGIDFSPSLDLEIDETPSFPRSIAAGDFDADSDPDLAIVANGDALAGQPERIVKILRNDTVGGQLAFSPAADQLAGLDPLIVLSGDVNGDGRDDLVTVNESAPVGARGSADRAGGSGVNVLVAAPAPCGGDVDGDGATTLRDLGILAANFGATGLPSGAGQSKALGDLDDDGDVDADDFNALAEHFGCDGR